MTDAHKGLGYRVMSLPKREGLPVKRIGRDDDSPSGGFRSLLRRADGCLQRVNAGFEFPTCKSAAERAGTCPPRPRFCYLARSHFSDRL